MDTITTVQSISIPLFNNVIVPIFVSFATTLIVWFGWWLKKQWQVKHDARIETQSKEKAIFALMLETHSRQFAHIYVNQERTSHNFEDNLAATRELLVWSADAVLSEYARYMRELSPEPFAELVERERHFGRAILAFRKQLGYDNKGVSADDAAVIFKAGWRNGHI